MIDFAALDNPVWHALTTVHRPLAMSAPLACRYPADVSPLVGLRDPSAAAFADLRGLVDLPDERARTIGTFTTGPLQVPDDWETVRAQTIDQMVCRERPEKPRVDPLRLRLDDVPDMLALTAATKPGPFLPRTIDMGTYLGVRSADGQLIAMAGQRLRLNGFTEISAVCTHPDFRGRGHAKGLIAALAHIAFDGGRIPFLHVKTENEAKAVYGKTGFAVRCPIHVTVMSPRPSTDNFGQQFCRWRMIDVHRRS